MGNVLVTGDVILHHGLLRSPGAGATTGGFVPRALMSTEAGGAWHLADLVGAACSDLTDWTVNGPTRPADPTRDPHDPAKRYAHGFAVWERFPREKGDKDPRTFVWRIREILGRHAAEEPEAPQFAQTDTRPDVLVLDDSDLGFRDREEFWPASLRDPGSVPGEIVLRTAERIGEGALWTRLVQRHGSSLTVVVPIDSLRTRQAVVSRGLSWDRTLDELSAEFDEGALSRVFVGVARVVILVPGAGVVWFSGGGPQRAPVFERCVFHPAESSDGWRRNHPGIVLGSLSVLAAAVARHLADPETFPGFVASARALEAMRDCHRLGAGAGAAFEPGLAAKHVGGALHPQREGRSPGPCDRCGGQRKGKPEADEEWIRKTEFRSTVPGRQAIESGLAPSNRENPRRNLLLDVTGGDTADVSAMATRIVREGTMPALDAAPCAKLGKLFTVDRDEIERINEIRSLIAAYQASSGESKPLAIAAFGPPGSGKSFSIKQIAEALFGRDREEFEFNLAQMDPASGDLTAAFHQVRDATIRGGMPFVFWDEFDSRQLGWLASFLAPIQDGAFRERGLLHGFGKAIFVFAGGTASTFDEFVEKHGEKSELKVLDFVSRLRGYLNVKGVKPASEADRAYVIRRACLLRSTIERNRSALLSPSRGLSIGAGVLHALLHVDSYEHGARSLESIVAMCDLDGASHFGASALPSRELLRLHVSDDFLDLVATGDAKELAPDQLEAMARGGHAGFRTAKAKQGYRYGPKQSDEPGNRTHPDLTDWEKLSDAGRRDNRDPVPRRWGVLQELGYSIVPSAPAALCKVDAKDLGVLVEREHQIWLRAKWTHGFALANRVDRALCLHTDMRPLASLPAAQQDLNHAIIHGMVEGLARAGWCLVKRVTTPHSPPPA